MGVETGAFVFFTFFQLAGIALLLRPEVDKPRRARFLLAALLLLNGSLTAFTALRSVVGSDPLALLAQAIDAPTGLLVLAYVATRHPAPRTALGLIAAAPVLAIAAYAWPSTFAAGPGGYLIITFPYYAGLLLLVLQAARGDATDRWIALAFLPRAMLFGSQSLIGMTFFDRAWPPLTLGGVFILLGAALALAMIAIALRLLRHATPPRAIVAAALLLAPADALALQLTPSPSPAFDIANYLTLALVRPLFLYRAFAPTKTWAFLAHTTFAAGIATAILALAPFIGWSPLVALAIASSLGAFTLALLRTHGTRRVPVVVDAPAAGAPSPPDRPQWQLILLRLRETGAGEGGPPRAEWTQSELAAATGLRVQRVSAFPESVNESAASHLATHLPGWKPESAAPAALVSVHRGSVPGLRGPRVYYRLTPLGVRLAEALAEAERQPARRWRT